MNKFSILLFLIIPFGVNAQCFFHRLYDDNQQYDGAFSVIQTLDGGYITCGTTTDLSLDGVYIVRTDVCGDTLWQKSYDFSPAGGDPGYSILQLQDSSFVICGWRVDTLEGATDTYLLKMDTNGDIIWYKPVEGGFNDRGVMHMQTNDEGFIIGGYNFDSALTTSQVFLIKTDSSGNVEWQKEYGDTTEIDYLKSIDFTADGGYILAGEFTNNATASWDLFLIKTDSLGDEEWKQFYGDAQDQRKGYAITTMDGGYAIAGQNKDMGGNIDAYIIKTDSSGIEEWSKTYGTPSGLEHFKFVRQLPDSSYIVAGGIPDTSGSPNGRKVKLMKLDTQGDSIWTRAYNYYGGSTHTYVEDLNLTSDGGFILTGYIINNALPEKNDLWMMKTDSLGNTCTLDTLNPQAGCWAYDCSYLTPIVQALDTVYLVNDTGSVQFTAGNQNATGWYWDFGDGDTSNLQNPGHTYDSAGIYIVTLIASNQYCSDTSTISIVVVDTTVGIAELSQGSMKVYPNPATNQITVTGNFNGPAIITLYDIMGRAVLERVITSGPVNISSINSGLYFYKITAQNSQPATGKLLVE